MLPCIPLAKACRVWSDIFCDKAYILTKKLNLVFHRSYTIQKIVCAFGDYVKLKFERFHCRGVVCIQQFKGTVFLSKHRRLLLIMVERNGRRIRIFTFFHNKERGVQEKKVSFIIGGG